MTAFRFAHPVWEKGMEQEMNFSLLFTANIPKGNAITLKIAAHCCYMLKINGNFLAAGPARAAHGFYRVDEISLSPHLTEESNVVSILCAGYNVNSYSYLDMPSFLCCEITAESECLAATGRDGFTASRYTERLQKVERYSFQRTFAEIYTLDQNFNRRETDPEAPCTPVPLCETEPKQWIDRGVYYPDYTHVPASEIMETGTVTRVIPEKYYTPRYITGISPVFKGFTEAELEENSLFDAQELSFTPQCAEEQQANGAVLPPNSYVTYRLPKNLTGFLTFTVKVETDTTIYITFDEVYNDHRVDMTRLDCANTVVWHLKEGGTYDLITFEPYTFRYLNIITLGGKAEVSVPIMIRYDFPAAQITQAVKMPDADLQAVYDAAVETFRQNTLDIYMDCPSRERAGWLCDSFFTSRVEFALTGKSVVERAFLENFLMPDTIANLPQGMIPMCYPSDHYNGVFIPNWAMWFVLQLAEHTERTGSRDLADRAKSRVYDLINYFSAFENEDGLLEKLESWVFLEWSRSNDLTQDINYPSNMLYAKALTAAADLYDDSSLRKKADDMKETIRRQSFMGDFFCDNALRGDDGIARLSREATESCQYYAFFTEVATPETYPELWETLVRDFGPDRKQNNPYPHIAFANSLVGNYLRLDLLLQRGLHDKVIDNIRGYFKYMADKTGTLWENDSDYASCNHGFSSHVIRWLNGIFG